VAVVCCEELALTRSQPPSVAAYSILGAPVAGAVGGGPWISHPDLVEPVAIGGGAAGTVVADPVASALYRRDGDRLVEISASPRLEMPSGVAARGAELLVSEMTAGRIARLSTSGARLGTLGAGALGAPASLAVAPDDGIVAVDSAGGGLVLLRGDGQLEAGWPPAGFEPVGVVDVAAGTDGTVYATDAFGLWAIAPAGAAVRVDPFGPARLGLVVPSGVAVDAAGRVYVADSELGAVHVLSRDPTAGFRIAIYANRWFTGAPHVVLARPEPQFDWATDGPVAGVDPTASSIRMEGAHRIDTGAYRVSLEAVGRARLWLGGRLVLEGETGGGPAAKWVVAVGAPTRLPMRLELVPSGSARFGLRIEAIAGLTRAYLPRADLRHAWR
jgi:DNA-binding beta-propeller fold protein YncE